MLIPVAYNFRSSEASLAHFHNRLSIASYMYMKEDVLHLLTSVGQRKNSESP